MSKTHEPHGRSLALLTDLYQLTMAFAYWKEGIAKRQAVFHLFFRKNPFGGGYALACGLESVIDYLSSLRFHNDDLSYLREVRGNDGKPLFEEGFLSYLRELKFSCDVLAVPEGTVVFPHEPLVRVQGPILEAQIIETALLNMVNFQTLVATKAALICEITGNEPVLEFGLRRAQGVDGSLSASRAAYVGGCAATSNVLASKLYGIPVKGTHAHSWVMSFPDESQAFDAYARAMPNNCVFLVDTYDTVEGIRRAVEIGTDLRQKGHDLVGIRLDSGNLADLSIEARKILDDGGFPNAVIVASNDLDEHTIAELKRQGSTIGVWGVGTKLATAYDQPALGGVYKLSALRVGESWSYKIKLSNEPIKVSNPGIQQVRRYQKDGTFLADLIYNVEDTLEDERTLVDLRDSDRRLKLSESLPYEQLLQPIFEKGRVVYQSPPLATIRDTAREQLQALGERVRKLDTPEHYPVGLDEELHKLKTRLINQAKPPVA